MKNLVKLQCYVPPYVKAEIDNRTNKHKNIGDVIVELLEISKATSLLKGTSNEDLNRACTIKSFSIEQLIKEALREYIDKVKKADKRGLTGHTKSIKADENMGAIVNSIIADNDKKEDINEVIYINQNSIINWLRNHNKPLVNFTVVKRYLRVHADFLREYHKKLNITETHNRDVFMNKRFNKLD